MHLTTLAIILDIDFTYFLLVLIGAFMVYGYKLLLQGKKNPVRGALTGF